MALGIPSWESLLQPGPGVGRNRRCENRVPPPNTRLTDVILELTTRMRDVTNCVHQSKFVFDRVGLTETGWGALIAGALRAPDFLKRLVRFGLHTLTKKWHDL